MSRHNTFYSVSLFAVLSLLCWGGLLTLKGIWWDDWAWVWHYYSTGNLHDFLLPFRDLHKQAEGILMFGLFNLLDLFHDKALLAWNVLKFTVLFINSLLIYTTTRALVGEKTRLPETISIIYLVSPAFNNLTLTVFPYNVELASFILSIYLSIKALKGEKLDLRYYIASTVFAFYSMVSLNSYIFFEALRPVLFYYVLNNYKNAGKKDSLKTSFIAWLPFLLIGIGIMAYFVTHPQTGAYAGTYKPEHFSMAYLQKISQRYISTAVYFAYVYFAAIKSTLKDPRLLYLLFAIIGSAAAFLKPKDEAFDDELSRRMARYFCFGLFVAILGFLPYALVRGSAGFGIESRHAILANVGFAILAGTALLFLYYKNSVTRLLSAGLFSILLFLSVMECRTVVNAYAKDWDQQCRFWKAFTGSVPELRENAFVVVDMEREQERYFGPWRGGYEFSAPLNLLYAKSSAASELHTHYAESIDSCDYAMIKSSGAVEFLSYSGKIQRYYPENLVYVSFKNDRLMINRKDPAAAQGNPHCDDLIKNSSSRQITTGTEPGSNYEYRWIIGL